MDDETHTVKDLTILLAPRLYLDKDREDTPERAGHDLDYVDYVSQMQVKAKPPNKQ